MSDLTAQEQANVRAALRFLRARSGGWMPVAKALHTNQGALAHAVGGVKPVTPRLAFRVARLANVSIDDLLAGKYPPPGSCPQCGHRK